MAAILIGTEIIQALLPTPTGAYPATTEQITSAQIASLSSGLSTNGYQVFQVTAATRTSTIYAPSQIVFVTDAATATLNGTPTAYWYRGDGQTAGGVLLPNNLPFTAQEFINLGIFQNRTVNVSAYLNKVKESTLTADIPYNNQLGNSIAQGAGVDNTSTQSWFRIAASALATYTGIGTQAQWVGSNYGVGGTSAAQPVCYLADSMITGALAGSNSYKMARSTLFNKANIGYFSITTLRNDANGALSLEQFKEMVRVCAQQCKRKRVDCVFTIDNPFINFATGIPSVTQNALDQTYIDALIQIAAEEGASVVNWWAYFNLLYNLGVNLKIFYQSIAAQNDGTHPGVCAQRDMGNMYALCLQYSATPGVNYIWNRPLQTSYRCAAYANWLQIYNNAGIQFPINNGTTLHGASGQQTARSLQLTEATANVIVVTGASAQAFINSVIPTCGIIVDWITDPSSTGVINNINQVGTIKVITQQPQSTITREFASYYDYKTASDTADLIATQITSYQTIVTVSGQSSYCGHVLIAPLVTEQHTGAYPNLVEVGTWSALTVSGSITSVTWTGGRSSSSVGDTATLTWYGTILSASFQIGTDQGKISVATDGGGSTLVDLYSGSFGVGQRTQMTVLAKDLTEGWHTTVITVATKNASSSSNVIAYANVVVQTTNATPSYTYISLAAGETMNVLDYWDYARIESGIGGTPTLQWPRGSNTIGPLGGTGGAVIFLSK